jgi:hypothetical protein
LGKASNAKKVRKEEERLLARLKQRIDEADPPNYDEEYASIKNWGSELGEIREEVDRLRKELGIDEPIRVEFVEFAQGGESVLGHYNLSTRTVELSPKLWSARPGWKRIVAIAHETFHVHQQDAMARRKAGTSRESDPAQAVIGKWRTYKRPYKVETVGEYDKGKSSRVEMLRMFEAYNTHPYEVDAESFGRSYLQRRR